MEGQGHRRPAHSAQTLAHVPAMLWAAAKRATAHATQAPAVAPDRVPARVFAQDSAQAAVAPARVPAEGGLMMMCFSSGPADDVFLRIRVLWVCCVDTTCNSNSDMLTI